MKAIQSLLSFNAGYVDTAGFLALHGLFTTHVTGNFVTFGAALALGTTGVLAKLLALPLFCVVIMLMRLLRLSLPVMLGAQFALLATGAALAMRFGPFPDGDALLALAVGAALVAAMAIQNATHRTHLAAVPATTVMTLTTTQVMVDLADIIRGADAKTKAAARRRFSTMVPGIVCFALGCFAAAWAYASFREACFLAPPVVALAVLIIERIGSREPAVGSV
ncbi:DUF1275 family protein [Hansschlegelia plantiphila]|uniref:Membrane protein n=1 Tax=Hansschlegelia plantiphila TaxID=374655 RepID=A0A9W6J4Y9_9HYPH|nr:YoaK family protein [Hansschlegelia plantiphila]GLK69353.1 membrane protein [Hansschlegelia plantiphila]